MDNFDEFDMQMERNRQTGRKRALIIAIIALCAVAVGVLLFLFVFQGGVPIQVEFEDASTLTKGTSVLYKGIEVGKVTNITLSESGSMAIAAIKINTEHAPSIKQGSMFVLSSGTDQDGNPRNVIRIEEVLKESPPVEKDDIFSGVSEGLPAHLKRIEMLGKDYGTKYLRLGSLKIENVVNENFVSRKFTVETGLLIPQSIFFSSLTPAGDEWVRDEGKTEDTQFVVVNGEFSHYDADHWNKSDLTISTEKNIFYTDYTYSEAFINQSLFTEEDLEKTKDTLDDILSCFENPAKCLLVFSDCVSDPQGCVEKVKSFSKGLLDEVKDSFSISTNLTAKNVGVTISVSMPGQIIDSSAPIVFGNQASWEVTGQEIQDGMTLYVKSRQFNFLTIGLIALGVVVIVAGLGWFISSKRKKKSDKGADEADIF